MATHELLAGVDAVQARGGFEETVSEGLQQRGYGQFLPCINSADLVAFKTQMVDRPLFPGYVFCRYIRVPRYRILAAPGVIRLVGFGNGP